MKICLHSTYAPFLYCALLCHASEREYAFFIWLLKADITENTGSIIQWVAFASNVFNVLVPFYGEVETTPEYLSNTTGEVSTENFYWASRMIAAMADASYHRSLFHIERYQMHVMAKGPSTLNTLDANATHCMMLPVFSVMSACSGRISITERKSFRLTMIAAMADASYHRSLFHIERYQMHVMAKGRELLHYL